MSPTTHPRRISVATLAVLALAAPAATARPAMDPPNALAAEPSSAPTVEAAAESFDWGAAGIGAALALVATGGFAAAHRSPAKSVR